MPEKRSRIFSRGFKLDAVSRMAAGENKTTARAIASASNTHPLRAAIAVSAFAIQSCMVFCAFIRAIPCYRL